MRRELITRLDLAGLHKDGWIDIVEVPSPTDQRSTLEMRGAILQGLGGRVAGYMATERARRKK